MQTIFIIFCHPCETSLNLYIKNRIAQGLISQEMNIRETIIYNVKEKIENKDLSFISDQRRNIEESDLILIQFPVYFSNFPALLHEYWMLVVIHHPQIINNKKILLSCTLGASRQDYSEGGARGSLENAFSALFSILFKNSIFLDPLFLFKDEYTINSEKRFKEIDNLIQNISTWPSKLL